MLSAVLIYFIKPLQNLYFPLIECLFFGLEFIFKALYGIVFASLYMPALVNMAETTSADEFFLFKFIP